MACSYSMNINRLLKSHMCELLLLTLSLCVRACVRACVRVCVRVCVRIYIYIYIYIYVCGRVSASVFRLPMLSWTL